MSLKMNRMFSIDLSSPNSSITGTGGGNKGSSTASTNYSDPKNFRFTAVNNESKIYEKYFQKRISKPISIIQLALAVGILIAQLSTTGLLIGPSVPTSPAAISTLDRIGGGIWASLMSSLAVGLTFWAMNRSNFCRLHSSMMAHFCSFFGCLVLEYLLLMNTIPNVQDRVYFLQQKITDATTLETRRVLLVADSEVENGVTTKEGQMRLQAELNRLYAVLVLTIIMALAGIFQLILHFFMTLKVGRTIYLGKTYFEGRVLQMQNIGSSWRNKSLRLDTKDIIKDMPILERSDALPPPPYESGYFHPSLTV